MTPPARLDDADAVIAIFERAAETMRASPLRLGSSVRLPARGRLIATGDLHDNPFHFKKIIGCAALGASPDHHVVLHELIHGDRLINGLDFSYRMLVRVAELVEAFPGQVHPLLANHELAQMTGKGVTKGAGNSVELFHEALAFVFGERCDEIAEAINGFIRAMPLALMTENGVLCAHSLPSASMMKHFDLDVLDRSLEDEDYLAPRGAAYLMTWGRERDDAQVEAFAERWDVKLLCLGHQYVETGIETWGSRVVLLNSDHDRAVILPLDLADVPDAEAAILYALPLNALP